MKINWIDSLGQEHTISSLQPILDELSKLKKEHDEALSNGSSIVIITAIEVAHEVQIGQFQEVQSDELYTLLPQVRTLISSNVLRKQWWFEFHEANYAIGNQIVNIPSAVQRDILLDLFDTRLEPHSWAQAAQIIQRSTPFAVPQTTNLMMPTRSSPKSWSSCDQ